MNSDPTGWSWGGVSTLDSAGRTIWIAGTHRNDGKRLVASADERLTAFLEFELKVATETPIAFPELEALAARLRIAATCLGVRCHGCLSSGLSKSVTTTLGCPGT